jgi:hypothetical protein
MSARWMVRLYPRAWRERYGAELEHILETQPTTPRLVADVTFGAIDAFLHPQLDPLPATQRGVFYQLPAALRSCLTPRSLIALAAYAGVVAGLGWLRRTYGFSFGLDFVYFAMNGLLPLTWLTSTPPYGLRRQGWRLLVVLPGAILAGLVGTVLTNGLPQ